MIRKAEKNGIVIEHGKGIDLFEKFIDIYNATMQKDNAEEYYYFKLPFYDSIHKDLNDNYEIFYAKLDDKIIAMSIMIFANGYMNYHLSGSLREFSSLAPGNLILYKAALWGCTNGYRTLYLGGGVGSGEDSLFKFKRAFFKGELNRFYIGKRILHQEKYDALLEKRGEVKSNYFPQYRAGGIS